MSAARLHGGLTFAATAIVIGACSTPDPGAREAAGAPDRATYAPVHDVLMNRCGTLDCHGSLYRNYRIFGYRGLRLSATNTTADAPDTTQEERDASFEAFIGLEPAIMRALMADGGKSPERLTAIRKGRGQEGHKGGQRIVPGSPGDLCWLAWLGGVSDATKDDFLKNCRDGILLNKP